MSSSLALCLLFEAGSLSGLELIQLGFLASEAPVSLPSNTGIVKYMALHIQLLCGC